MIRNGIVAFLATILIVAGPVAAPTPLTASESVIERQYLSMEFSPDGEKLLLQIIDISVSEPKAWAGYVELLLDSDPPFRALEYDCNYHLKLARYMPDGDSIVYVLSPPFKEGQEFDTSRSLLIVSDIETGKVSFTTEMLSAEPVDLAVSDDGRALYVAYQSRSESMGDVRIFRYRIDSGKLEKVFENVFSNIRFISFLEATDTKVSFRATKDFSDLTQEDVELLGSPGLVMIDESYLLFETTDDPKVAILSGLYPSLKKMLESYKDLNSQWPTTIYYLGAGAQYESGQMHIPFAMPAAAERGGTVAGIYTVGETDITLLFEPGFDFEQFAVSPDGKRIAFVHREDSGAATVTLFEQSAGEWQARPLSPTLDRIASVDPCER